MPIHLSLPHLRGRHLFAIDLIVIVTAAAISLAVWADLSPWRWTVAIPAAVAIGITRPFVNVAFGMYRRAWQHASVPELLQVSYAVIAGSLLALAATWGVLVPLGIVDGANISRSFWLIEGLLSLALLGGVRFAIRALADSGRGPSGVETEGVPMILYGAGHAGVMVARSARDPRAKMRFVGFLDDDDRLHGQRVEGLSVLGGLESLGRITELTGARRLLITMPDADSDVIRRIVQAATAIGLEVRTIPMLHEMLDGSIDASRIRRVKVEDLLHRPAVRDHLEGVDDLITDRVVLITGAGGSIGSELARQVSMLRPSKLVLVDRAEGPLYGIERELQLMGRRGHGSERIIAHIANVVTRATMRRVIGKHRPHIIFHAAAYKHVPMMEQHPSDAVHVNIRGTLAVLEAAEAFGVEHLVFVSTDKAVHPSSVMGATKRVAEGLVADAAVRTGKSYVSVRFGNVLGSSGSVVPIFQQQLENGDPLTITHKDMTRYFMTIPEAVWLILEAAALGKAGDLLVLDMGEPIRITDLANDLIRLSGRDPETVLIEFTGLRPGEKLHEQLFYDTEQVRPTENPKVMLAAPQPVPIDFNERITSIVALASGDHDEALRDELFELTRALEQDPLANRAPVRTRRSREQTPVASSVGGR